MKPFTPKPSKGPEAIIQSKVIRALRGDGWYVKVAQGNEYQSGFPDLYACHIHYGSRWIEIKCPTGYNFTVAQEEDFRLLTQHGSGVWVLTDEREISRLHTPANWYTYLRWNSRSAAKQRKESKQQAFGPEYEIQQEIKKELHSTGWFVKETVGTIYQSGFPDLYATHPIYRARWIEVKNPIGYVFTPAQLEVFPQFSAHGVGVWVMTAPGQSELLFKSPNWWRYLEIMQS